jgi:hypothetical protein
MGRGLTILAAGEIVSDADAPEIPAGNDGETAMRPRRCTAPSGHRRFVSGRHPTAPGV